VHQGALVGTLLVPVFTAAGLGATAAAIAANLAAGLLLSVAALALAPRPRIEEQDRELQTPSSLPPQRFAYGRARIPATAWAAVEPQRTLYAAYLLNSRPSSGDFTVYLDKREITVSGDIFDFETGATATNDPFGGGGVRLWIGRGDQTAPPDLIMSEVGDATSTNAELFWPTDALEGLTVLWLRAERGPAQSLGDRWPRWPPEVHVLGDWSLVWDPRDDEQDADDPDTWGFSDNQALCLLDALRHNPVRRWPLRQIDLDTFEDAADLADEEVALKAGGTAPRYRVGGVVAWGGRELHDLLRPMAEAGGGDLVRRGGRVGYVPGAYVEPTIDVGDLVTTDGPLEFRRLAPGAEIPRAVRGVYPDPAAEWEASELPDVTVDGGQRPDGSDDGVEVVEWPLVPYPQQVARLAQARARQHARQKRISCVLEPGAFDVAAGCTVDFTVPRTGDPRSGVYQVVETRPAEWLTSDAGVAMRLPVTMRETAAEVWEWTAATDEPDFLEEPVPAIGGSGGTDGLDIEPPEMLTAVGGATQIDVDLRAPNGADYRGVEVWAAATGDPTTSVRIAGPIFTAPNATVSIIDFGLGAGVTRHYWGRSVASNNALTDFSSTSVSATTDL
jgi:hypothetical protein